MKSVQIWKYFWSLFSCIRTEYRAFMYWVSQYWVIPLIQSEYRKIRTTNNPVFGHISCSVHNDWTETLLTPFRPIFHSYTPWKRQKTLRFFDVFMEYRNGVFGWYGLIMNFQALFFCSVLRRTCKIYDAEMILVNWTGFA